MERQPFAPIAQAEKRRFAPGETAQPEQFSPGDFILTHSNSFYGWLIRFGQRLRFRGEDRKYGWWNHAAVIVSTDGDLIEALNAGVRRTNITAYASTDYTLVHLQPSLADERDSQTDRCVRELVLRPTIWLVHNREHCIQPNHWRQIHLRFRGSVYLFRFGRTQPRTH